MSLSEITDDFVGWKSEDGKLEVVGVAGKTRSGRVVYKVICTECSKDIELFPQGYFITSKNDLKRGRSPCGCGSFRYSEDQQLLRINRVVGGKFIVHGFVGSYKNSSSKLNCECDT